MALIIAFFLGVGIGLIILYGPLHREEMEVKWYKDELAKELSRSQNLTTLLKEEVDRFDEWVKSEQKKADEDAERSGE